MRVKKATKPKRSIRYLLSADRKLQKLTLKRMSELKKAKQPARSIQSKNSSGAKPSPSPRWAMGGPAIVLGIIGVVAAATLITAGQPSSGADVAVTETPRASSESQAAAPAAARLETKKLVSPTAPPRPAVSLTPAAKVATADSQPTESARTSVTAESTIVPTVTVTGCLERDGEAFWLKDTSGADAPKSRSWKSGFLKKRSSRIELVDATNTLRLTSHVGQRVTATGILTNREMRARSLRSAAGFCD